MEEGGREGGRGGKKREGGTEREGGRRGWRRRGEGGRHQGPASHDR